MSRSLNPLNWRRDHLILALALVVIAAVVGAIIGHHWARNIISREHLSPADPYLPIIYQKFIAAWAVGLAVAIAVAIYLFEYIRG
jgi:hypothetical protein